MKDDNIEFVDNYNFIEYEIPVHVKIGGVRYWIVVCKKPTNKDTYNNDSKYCKIFRIEVHVNEVCELFTHTRMMDRIIDINDLLNSIYFDIVKKALLSDPQFNNLKLLDSNYCTVDYFSKKMYLPWYKRIFTKGGL